MNNQFEFPYLVCIIFNIVFIVLNLIYTADKILLGSNTVMILFILFYGRLNWCSRQCKMWYITLSYVSIIFTMTFAIPKEIDVIFAISMINIGILVALWTITMILYDQG